jgi:hypothetical protein
MAMISRTHLALAALAAPLLVLASGVGCGGHDSSPAAAADPDVIVGPHTKVLDAPTLALVSTIADDRSTVSLTASTKQIDGLAAGDVIVAPVSATTPAGLMRKVVSVTRDASGAVVIATGPAGLADAFERLRLTVHRELGTGDLAPASAGRFEGARLHPQTGGSLGAGLTIGVDNLVLFDVDGDTKTTDDQVRVSGNVSLNPSIDLVIDIESFSLKTVSFTVTGAESASIDLTVEGGYTFDKSVLVPGFTFAPITIPAGDVPLVFFPQLDFRFGASGTLDVKFEMGATQTASVKAGVAYQNGAWAPVKETQLTAQLNPPSIDGKLALKAFAGPELQFKLYGTGGPYVDLTGYLKLTADTSAKPCLSVHAGADAKLGVKLEELDQKVVDYNASLNLFDLPILSASCTPSLPPDTFWSKTYSSKAASPEGATFVATVDGGFLVVARSADLVLKIDAKGNIVWQRQFTNFHDVRAVVVLPDGTYAVAGTSSGGWLAKLDAAGAVLWSKRYTADSGATLEAVTLVATAGGFFLAGTVQNGDADVWALETDGNGAVLWSKGIGGPKPDHAEGARLSTDGHRVIVGTNGAAQGMALSLGADGAIAWQRQYGGVETVQSLHAITSAPNGGFVLAGTIQEGPATHGWLLRVGPDGSLSNGPLGSVQYLAPMKPDGSRSSPGSNRS